MATELSSDGKFFNITGFGVSTAQPMSGDPWAGSISGNTVTLKITAGSFGKNQQFVDQLCKGTFSPDCNSIDWVSDCLKQSDKPPHPNVRRSQLRLCY